MLVFKSLQVSWKMQFPSFDGKNLVLEGSFPPKERTNIRTSHTEYKVINYLYLNKYNLLRARIPHGIIYIHMAGAWTKSLAITSPRNLGWLRFPDPHFMAQKDIFYHPCITGYLDIPSYNPNNLTEFFSMLTYTHPKTNIKRS